jgi:hypothetical protein
VFLLLGRWPADQVVDDVVQRGEILVGVLLSAASSANFAFVSV